MRKTQTSNTRRIRRLLIDKDLKQDDIAKRLKVSKSLISQAISEKPKKLPILQKRIIDYLSNN